MGKPQLAVDFYCAALTHDPLLWSAYEELCQLGRPPGPWS